MVEWLSSTGLAAGIGLGAVVSAQVGFSAATWAARLKGDARRRALEQEKLAAEIELLKAKAEKVRSAEKHWAGVRKFYVQKKVMEAPGVASIYLRPHDRRNLPPYEPGQYLTFHFNIPGQKKDVIRCYSLSDKPGVFYYRITVKKQLPPPGAKQAPHGLASSHVVDRLREGDILDVKAPRGQFYVDTALNTPVVLIGAGIGITPVLSMLNTIADNRSTRETWFFYGVRDGSEHVMRGHLAELRSKKNIHVVVAYSAPRPEDELGRDYDRAGRVGVDLFRELLPSNNYDYYMCGPGPMMESLSGALEKWGVPERNIHYENFGPASVGKALPAAAAGAAPAAGIPVTFSRSQKRVQWVPANKSLLDLADSCGVSIASGCRAGNCGTCLTAITEGKVKYASHSGFEPEPQSCLPCIGTPDGPVTLDA